MSQDYDSVNGGTFHFKKKEEERWLLAILYFFTGEFQFKAKVFTLHQFRNAK